MPVFVAVFVLRMACVAVWRRCDRRDRAQSQGVLVQSGGGPDEEHATGPAALPIGE